MTSASPPRHRLSPRSTTGAGSAHLAEMTRARAGRAGSQSYASTTDWGRPAPEPVSINGHSQIGERTPLATKAEDEFPDGQGPVAMWRILPGGCSLLTFVLPGPYSQVTLPSGSAWNQAVVPRRTLAGQPCPAVTAPPSARLPPWCLTADVSPKDARVAAEVWRCEWPMQVGLADSECVLGRVGGGVFPVIGRDDLGFEVRVLGQEVEQVRSVDELDGLVAGELEAGLPVPGGGDEDSLARALVLQGAEQVPDGGDADGVLVALGLDDDFAAEDRPRVPGDAVDSAVARGTCLAGFESHRGEQVLDQGLELGGCQLHEVGALVEPGQRVAFGDEPGIDHAELEDRAHGHQLGRALGHRGGQVLQARQGLYVREVQLAEDTAGSAQGSPGTAARAGPCPG